MATTSGEKSGGKMAKGKDSILIQGDKYGSGTPGSPSDRNDNFMDESITNSVWPATMKGSNARG